MSVDMSATIAPKSDQLNADDLISGPRTVTVTGISRGEADQPVNIATAEFGDGRPFKPCKSMRRVMVQLWGPDASAYVGRRMTLYREPEVKFGGQTVGGIRISHMSDLDKKVTLALTATRGKRSPFVVEPLRDDPKPEKAPPITDDEAADFARDIAESATFVELEAVATALKSCDLGSHRKRIQQLWAERKRALSVDADRSDVAEIAKQEGEE